MGLDSLQAFEYPGSFGPVCFYRRRVELDFLEIPSREFMGFETGVIFLS